MKNKCPFPSLALLALLILGHESSVFAQNTAFTYQGHILDNGTNFTGIGQFKFALVTSTNFNHQAMATANLGGVSPNFFVSGCTLNNGGSGYVTVPAVTITGGGGSGATAAASLTGGSVSSVTVLTPGSGYTSTPTVTVAPPPANISYATYWSNDGSSSAGSEPSAAVSVGISNGLFTIILGDTTVANMTAISASLFTQPNLQLRIWFNDGSNGFAALSPLQNLAPTPYAVQAFNANNASNLLGVLPVSQLSGTLTPSQLPYLPLTNNATNVNLNGNFAGDGSGLYNTVTSLNYFFANNLLSSQTNNTANTFQTVNFDSPGGAGWTYSTITGSFTCSQTGTYLIQYDAEVESTTGELTKISLRAFNQTTAFEIPGSESLVILDTANRPLPVSKSFLASFIAGDALQIQFTGSNTSATLVAGNSTGTYQPCISCTIVRIR